MKKNKNYNKSFENYFKFLLKIFNMFWIFAKFLIFFEFLFKIFNIFWIFVKNFQYFLNFCNKIFNIYSKFCNKIFKIFFQYFINFNKITLFKYCWIKFYWSLTQFLKNFQILLWIFNIIFEILPYFKMFSKYLNFSIIILFKYCWINFYKLLTKFSVK